MPQLPSGKHFAIGPEPLNAWRDALREAGAGAPWPATVAQILPHLELLWLEPTDTSGPLALTPASAQPPAGLGAVATGFRLSRLDDFLATLPAVDAGAVRAYIERPATRAQFEAWLAVFTAEARRLRHGPYGWDLHDLFAALLRFDRARTRGLLPAGHDTPLLADLHGLVEAVRDGVPVLRDIEQASESVSQLAATLRAQRFFADPEGREDFSQTLLGIAWRLAGDLWLEDLRAMDEEAIDIIGLAAVGYDPQTKRHVTFRDGVAREPEA